MGIFEHAHTCTVFLSSVENCICDACCLHEIIDTKLVIYSGFMTSDPENDAYSYSFMCSVIYISENAYKQGRGYTCSRLMNCVYDSPLV